MARPKRMLHATALLTTSPPPLLSPDHSLVRILKAAGNNLYLVELPSLPSKEHCMHPEPQAEVKNAATLLVELQPRFRNTIYLKRGSVVLIDTSAFADRDNKLGGEIVNVVRDEKEWRRMPYWPQGLTSKRLESGSGNEQSSDEEDNVVGKLPPGFSDEETSDHDD